MDLQTRKIEFVQEFLKLQSERTIILLEKLLKKEVEKKVQDIQPMTIQQFQERIRKSRLDVESGKLTEANDLISEIQKWS